MGLSSQNQSGGVDIKAALEPLQELLQRIGLGRRLGDYDFQEGHMDTIVQATLASAQCPTNPRNPTTEDIANLVHSMV
jgi:alcohol dehydrogenase